MAIRTTFVDTSAFYAIIDRSDSAHADVAATWTSLLETEKCLITSNYVLLETIALLQNRISNKAALLFQNDILNVIDIHWITQTIHELSVELWKSQNRRHLSLVDCSSFILMGQCRCDEAFSLDTHFAEHGYVHFP